MMDTSWAMQAIEREAMARARRDAGPLMYLAGVNAQQLLWLINDYRVRTGSEPSEIDPRAPFSGKTTTSSEQA